jgi:hypothetical protein
VCFGFGYRPGLAHGKDGKRKADIEEEEILLNEKKNEKKNRDS